MFLSSMIVVGWGLTKAVLADPPAQPPFLAGLKDGQWELRQRGSSAVERICARGGSGLIQLRHPGRSCERIVLNQAEHSIVVQYTCKGSGFGRTSIRRETSQLVQIETQGVADGFPFDYAVEGRWLRECPRVAG